MDDEKWAPGPWNRDKYGAVIGADGNAVMFRGTAVLASGAVESMREAEANTDLLAAAPDLYKALDETTRTLLAWIGRYSDENPWRVPGIKQAVEALAKARGESNG